MVRALFLHFDRAVIHVYGTRAKRELPAIIEREHAVGQRPVGDDLELRLGALDGPQIASMLLDRVGQVHPVRMLVCHPDLFHARDIGDPQMKMGRLNRARFHKILNVLWNSGEQKLGPVRSGLRQHGHLFPLRRTLVAHVDPQAGLQPRDRSRDELIRMASYRRVPGADTNTIEGGGARPGPQRSSAIAEIAGAGTNQPDESPERHDAHNQQRNQHGVRCHGFDIRGARNSQGIRSQQLQERIPTVTVALTESQQPLLELRKCTLRPRQPAPAQPPQW